MNYKHFGELLKDIRKSKDISLEQLADNICSVRQLCRIENGENNPSLYILHNFSKKLNIDLQEYYRIYFTSGSFEAYHTRSKINQLIRDNDLDQLKMLIDNVENGSEFKIGENRQYILYGKALCISYIEKNYLLSNEYLSEGLTIEDPSFNINTIKDKIYSNVGLTMLNLLASNYSKIGESNLSFTIFENVFSVLENHIFTSPFTMYRSLDFEKKLYQSSANNLSFLYMNKSQYKLALEYVDKGIKFSKKHNYMRFLPELLAQKARLLYKMDIQDESYEAFKDCLSLYRLLREDDSIKALEDEIKNTFR